MMYRIAIKMLVEDKAKFMGMVLGLSFSCLIIVQQMAIFLGLIRRTYSLIADTPQAQVWVMNKNVKMIDDANNLREIDLFRIRSIEGVQWAMPMFKGAIRSKLPNGQFQNCNVIGIDSATLIGGPHTMLEGSLDDLRRPFSIIVNYEAAHDKLAQNQGPGLPKKPLKVGDVIELNDRRAKVVGICKLGRTFRSDPVVYTTFSNALFYVPAERKQLSFILAAPDNSITPEMLCRRIEELTEFKAFTKKEFEQVTVDYYMQNTGIPINFGIAVLLGLLVGAAITGQIFFNFITDNLRYFALFNVVGASRRLLAIITLLQGSWVAFIGWGIGIGAAALLGIATQHTQLAFYQPWWLFLGSGLIMWIICIISSLIAINRIFNIELSSMFKQ